MTTQATSTEFDQDAVLFDVAYRLTEEPAEGGAAVISLRQPFQMKNWLGGVWVTTIGLTTARLRGGQSDEEAARRIIAIAHPGTVNPESVELVQVRGVK